MHPHRLSCRCRDMHLDERAVQQYHHRRGRQTDYVLETAVLSAFSSLLSSLLFNVFLNQTLNWWMCNDSTLLLKIWGFSFLNHDDFIQSHLLSSIKPDKNMVVLGARTFFWRQRTVTCDEGYKTVLGGRGQEELFDWGNRRQHWPAQFSKKGRSLWPKCPVVTRGLRCVLMDCCFLQCVCPDSKNLGEECTVYSNGLYFITLLNVHLFYIKFFSVMKALFLFLFKQFLLRIIAERWKLGGGGARL